MGHQAHYRHLKIGEERETFPEKERRVFALAFFSFPTSPHSNIVSAVTRGKGFKDRRNFLVFHCISLCLIIILSSNYFSILQTWMETKTETYNALTKRQ